MRWEAYFTKHKNCTAKRDIGAIILGGTGGDVSLWNSADIKELNLNINLLTDGFGQAIKKGAGISNLTWQQEALTISIMHPLCKL